MRAARPEEVARSAESLSTPERAPELVFGGGVKVTFAFPIFGKPVPLLLVTEASWEPWTTIRLEASVQTGMGAAIAGGAFFYLENEGFGKQTAGGFSVLGGRGYGGEATILLEDKYRGRFEIIVGAGGGVAGVVPIYVRPLGSRQWGN
jgi:hypothetical protein